MNIKQSENIEVRGSHIGFWAIIRKCYGLIANRLAQAKGQWLPYSSIKANFSSLAPLILSKETYMTEFLTI